MISLTINNKVVSVPKGTTLIQACEKSGVEIPRFCYHERLSIAGNCRMCLVEIEGVKKPVASCAMPANDGMKILTNSDLVKKAREGVLELLLVNHPLDCPICDQGGECDLQDQAMMFGSDRGRFNENKRSVTDKDLGPLIKTIMTRCIHCTRCVRFATEIAGVEALGTTGRGKDTEVGTYISKFFDSELSGNVIDLCPVGALTSKPYAFVARPWELDSIESIDIMDGTGSNIIVQTRGSEIVRVLPKEHDGINQEWLGDKSRFSYDGLSVQRINTPYIRKGDKLQPTTFKDALSSAVNLIRSSNANNRVGLVGRFCDLESIHLFKQFFNGLNSNKVYNSLNSYKNHFDFRKNYIFNNGISNIDKADAIFIIGSDIRSESPVINARIRGAVRKNGISVYSLGASRNLGYEKLDISDNSSVLYHILQGRHSVCSLLARYKNPMVILGSSTIDQSSNSDVIALVSQLKGRLGNAEVVVLHDKASFVGSHELGVFNGPSNLDKGSDLELLYVLGDVEIDLSSLSSSTKIIYQGHHGNEIASKADVILPSCTYIEKSGLYMNTEGRVQQTNKALSKTGVIKNDWEIIRALQELYYLSGNKLFLGSYLSSREEIIKDLGLISGSYLKSNFNHLPQIFVGGKVCGVLDNFNFPHKFRQSVPNYYLSDCISKASRTMSKCSKSMKWYI